MPHILVVLRRCVTLALLLASTGVEAATIIWEKPLGNIVSGMRSDGLLIQRTIDLVVVDSRYTQRNTKDQQGVDACVHASAQSIYGILSAIDSSTRTLAELNRSYPGQNFDLSNDEVNTLVKASTILLDQAVGRCVSRLNSDEISLGLVQRLCAGDGADKCSGVSSKDGFAGSPNAYRFRKLFIWMNQYLPAKRVATFQAWEAGEALLIARTGDKLSKLNSTILPANDLVEKIPLAWPYEAQANIRLSQFVKLVEIIRSGNTQQLGVVRPYIDASALVTNLVTQGDSLQVLDVIDSPAVIYAQLSTSPALLTEKISNEVSRSRVVQCYFYAPIKLDEQSIGDCAGVVLSGTELANCIGGRMCSPAWNASHISPEALLNISRNKLSDFAKGGILPRLELGSASTLITSYNNCSKSAGATANKEAFAACFLAKLGTGNANAALSCVSSSASDVKGIGSCLAKRVPEAANIVKCGAALSDAKGSAEISGALACVFGTKGNEIFGPLGACLDERKSGNAALLDCVLKSEKLVSPDAVRVVSCITETGGDPWGIAICGAGDKLNAEARIALQCAVSNGGNPVGTLGCTAGQLTLKELKQCVGGKFGDTPCFGPGNEIQKLSKALFGATISSGSVVGQVANLNIKAVTGTLNLTENSIREAGIALNNIGREGEILNANMTRELANFNSNVTGFIADTAGGVSKAGNDAKNFVNRTFGIHL